MRNGCQQHHTHRAPRPDSVLGQSLMPKSRPGHVRISDDLIIPESELRFRFVRSRGPGGQHVNKTATHVELAFDVAGSPSLDELQRERIRTILGNRIDADGVMRIAAQSTRSQLRNRQEAVERLRVLLADALRPRKWRRPTRPSAASRETRLEQKKRRGAVKRARRCPDITD